MLVSSAPQAKRCWISARVSQIFLRQSRCARPCRSFVDQRPVGYAPVGGLSELRDAVAQTMSAYHGEDWTREHVLVSCGAKHSLANLFLATLDPDDEVVIPAPYWVSYPEMVSLAGGRSVIVSASAAHAWKLRAEELAAVVTKHTRFLVINNPCNPTGAAYTAGELRELGQVLAERAPQAWVVVDDIYRQLVYGDAQHVSAVEALPRSA